MQPRGSNVETVRLVIDGREVEAEPGEKVLEAALREGIFIPHLCYLPGLKDAFGACRLCFVEVEGRGRPLTSCALPVEDGMVIRTDSPQVRRLQRSALRLLLSVHHVDCRNCYANKRCKLQNLAKRLRVGLKVTGLRDLSSRCDPLDTTLERVFYDPSKCVLCGACVRICASRGLGPFHFSQRGLRTRIAVFARQDREEILHECMEACPVGALIPSDGRWQIRSASSEHDIST
jgi:formate dehydrogenase major subunit/NADH-quinone oxidoreductase subunit G